MGNFAEAVAPPPPSPPSPVASQGQPDPAMPSAVRSPVDVLAGATPLGPGRTPAVEVEADPEASQVMGMSSRETAPGSASLQFMAVRLEEVRRENAALRRVKVDLETQVDLLEAHVSSLLRMVTEDRRRFAEQTARLEQQQQEVEQLRLEKAILWRGCPPTMEVKEDLQAPQAMVTSSGETVHSSAPPHVGLPARLEQLRQENAGLRRAKAALEVQLATAQAAASAGETQTNQQLLLKRICLRQEMRLEQRGQALEQQQRENAALRLDKLMLQEELSSLQQQVSWLAAGSQRLHKEAEARDREVLALRAALAQPVPSSVPVPPASRSPAVHRDAEPHIESHVRRDAEAATPARKLKSGLALFLEAQGRKA
eukprot:EG_transcript_13241